MATRAIRLIACYFELLSTIGLAGLSLSFFFPLSLLRPSVVSFPVSPSDRGATNPLPRSASERRNGFMRFGS